MNTAPFSPGLTVTLAVTTTTGAVALGAGVGSVVEVQNTGTSLMFVKIGRSTVTATTADYPVQPGHSKMVTRAPNVDTHIAAITGTSTATLYATVGEGI